MHYKIVIIGGVAGGATAAAKARREDEHAEITVIERGPFVSFANCGLPYYIGRDIEKREALLLQTPEGFWERYRVQVQTQTEVLKIDRENKKLLCRGPQGEFEKPYDRLIISQGANPILPPVPGREAPFVFSLRDMQDMDRIDNFMAQAQPKRAVVVGGGFIGLEMAEAFHRRGLEVTLVEKAPQVMSILDLEFGRMVEGTLKEHQVKLLSGTSIQKIESTPHGRFQVEDGSWHDTDLILFAIGVRPELELAKAAGLSLGSLGGVIVNEEMKTSDPNIFAVGDMVEIHHRILNKMVRVPLAGPANRQGRIAAQNAVGVNKARYHGAIASSVAKIFDKTVASTGLTERQAQQAGFTYGAITVHPRHHAGYYPGAQRLTLKLVFDKSTGLILGAQAFGAAGVEKRIDVIAAAILGKLKVADLEELDLCYAPPYSSANDPVNMAGFVAANEISGYSPSLTAQQAWTEIRKAATEDLLVVDVRDEFELSAGVVPNSKNIPMGQLRDRLGEISAYKNKKVLVHCAVGYRGHLALRVLKQSGFSNVLNISGGYQSLAVLAEG